MHKVSNDYQLIHSKALTSLLAVCFVAVFIWVGAYVITGSRAEPSQPTGTAIITMSDHGFLPQTATVQPDTKVVWVNLSPTSHVPETDPSYQTSGAFPAPLSLGQNDSFSHVFLDPGTYHLRDRDDPAHTGTLIVE